MTSSARPRPRCRTLRPPSWPCPCLRITHSRSSMRRRNDLHGRRHAREPRRQPSADLLRADERGAQERRARRRRQAASSGRSKWRARPRRAQSGISVSTFPPGTIFSVSLHPLRSGEPAGAREGALFKCPAKTPPAAGKHCDTVEGKVAKGSGFVDPAQQQQQQQARPAGSN